MLQERLLHWLLPKLIAKKSPRSIPRNGEKGKAVNFFTIFLGHTGQKPTYLVDGYDSHSRELNVLSLDSNDTFSVEETISLSEALKYEVRVNHYYGLYDLYYTNIYDLAFNLVTRYDEFKVKIRILWSLTTQAFFNKRKLITKDSIELLRFMLDRQLKGVTSFTDSWAGSQADGVDVFSLMTELYTQKWIEHPDSAREKARLALHLESLVSSEDLKMDSHRRYIVQGRALKTLEQYEENDRRHKDSVRIQKGILWLTIILAFAALSEAELINLPPIIKWPIVSDLYALFATAPSATP